jgi:hypothetical protein
MRWIAHHAHEVIRSLGNDISPHFEDVPIRIAAPTVLAALRLVEKRAAADTGRRIRQRVSAVFVFGIRPGKLGKDVPMPKVGPLVGTMAI